MEADDEDWEETVVFVELTGIIDQDWTANIGENCKILGLDTEQPVMQIDRYIFTGEYKDAIGTYVMFEEVEDDETVDNDDGEERPSGRLEYKYKTHKMLKMQRTFLVDKEEAAANTEQDTADSSKTVRAETDTTQGLPGGTGSTDNPPPEQTEDSTSSSEVSIQAVSQTDSNTVMQEVEVEISENG